MARRPQHREVSASQVLRTKRNTRSAKKALPRRSNGKAAILVLGMHRSGTSALTRVLNLLGCDLPKTLMLATRGNELGHWESSVICHLNDRILESAGSNWNDWGQFNPQWYNSPRAAHFEEEAVAALASEFGSSPLFVLKDPRICRFPAFWFQAVEKFDADPFVIIPIRNPLEVAASLNKRDGFDTSLGCLLWLRNVLDAEYASRGRRRFFHNYDALLSGWQRPINAMQSEFGLVLPRASASVAIQIDEFLSEQNRHQRALTESVIDNPSLSQWLRKTYAIFHRWGMKGKGEDAADFATLDAVRAALDEATPAFSRLVEVGRKALADRNNLEQNLTKTREQHVAAEARLGALERDASGLTKQLAEASAKLAHTESSLAQRRHETEEQAQEIAVAREQLRQLSAARSDLEALLAKHQEQANILTKGMREQQQDAAAHAAEARKLKAQKEQAEGQLKERFGEIAALTEMLKSATAAHAAEAQKVRAEKDQVEGQIKERFDEIAMLTKMLKGKEAVAAQLQHGLAALVEIKDSSLPWRWIFRSRQVRQKIDLLKRSGVFDAEWYLKANDDVRASGMDPARHYVEHGAKEGRAPNALLAESTSDLRR